MGNPTTIRLKIESVYSDKGVQQARSAVEQMRQEVEKQRSRESQAIKSAYKLRGDSEESGYAVARVRREKDQLKRVQEQLQIAKGESAHREVALAAEQSEALTKAEVRARQKATILEGKAMAAGWKAQAEARKESTMAQIDAVAEQIDAQVKGAKVESDAASARNKSIDQAWEQAEAEAEAAKKASGAKAEQFQKSRDDGVKAAQSQANSTAKIQGEDQHRSYVAEKELRQKKSEEAREAAKQFAADFAKDEKAQKDAAKAQTQVEWQQHLAANAEKAKSDKAYVKEWMANIEDVEKETKARERAAQQEEGGGNDMSGFGGKMILGYAASTFAQKATGDQSVGQALGTTLSAAMFSMSPAITAAVAGMEVFGNVLAQVREQGDSAAKTLQEMVTAQRSLYYLRQDEPEPYNTPSGKQSRATGRALIEKSSGTGQQINDLDTEIRNRGPVGWIGHLIATATNKGINPDQVKYDALVGQWDDERTKGIEEQAADKRGQAEQLKRAKEDAAIQVRDAQIAGMREGPAKLAAQQQAKFAAAALAERRTFTDRTNPLFSSDNHVHKENEARYNAELDLRDVALARVSAVTAAELAADQAKRDRALALSHFQHDDEMKMLRGNETRAEYFMRKFQREHPLATDKQIKEGTADILEEEQMRPRPSGSFATGLNAGYVNFAALNPTNIPSANPVAVAQNHLVIAQRTLDTLIDIRAHTGFN